MTPAELTAATLLYNALTLYPCTCRYQFPYNLDPGEHLHCCHRCKALSAWDEVRCEALKAELAAGRVPA